eukprot:m.32327 g.32327  ORF g.32327 m.32327 type:complete len:276 (+) comp6376_c0_seq3:45-872(+)
MSKTHIKCTEGKYPGGPERANVEHVSWKDDSASYKPVEYTSKPVADGPVWADDPAALKSIKFNTGSRKSHEADYEVTKDNMPINPIGRTGISGRGLLGKFGPNFAADPIVSRWKRNENNELVYNADGKPILQLVLIKRRDNGQWALPGGMVDEGEQVSLTLAREFSEEALNSMEMSEEEKHKIAEKVHEAFTHGEKIYEGYVDDPRNTDNSWMETTAVSFHDEDGALFSAFNLNAGDDAGDVSWVDVQPDMNLYASHDAFVEKVYAMRLAGFSSK